MNQLSIVPIRANTETIEQAIEKAATQWRELKRKEETSRDQRIKFEKRLIELIQFKKLEGSQTIKTGQVKITLTAKLNRKLDTHQYLTIRDDIPINLNPIEEKITYKVLDNGCRWLEDNEPEVWQQIVNCLTTTPAKTTVKVEIL